MRKAWFPDKDGDHRVFWHWQNLRRAGQRRINGRAWLNVPRAVFGLEWAIPSGRHASVSFSLDDRDGPGIHAHIDTGLAAVYGSLEWRPLRRLMPTRPYRLGGRTVQLTDPREVSVQIHHGSLWWRLWTNPMEWHSKTPRWREGSWDPMRTLFGRQQYTNTVLESADVQIPMPERSYAARVNIEEAAWKRPRWPWARRVLRADIDIPGGVPVPGKGENSWDMDEDAIFGMTTPAADIPAAVAAVVESAYRTRSRYGGAGWVPQSAGKEAAP